MACVHIIYEEDGILKKAQFCYFDGACEATIRSYFTKERQNFVIQKVYIAKDTNEMIKLLENEDGMV